MARIQIFCVPNTDEQTEARMISDIPDKEAVTDLLIVRVGTADRPATSNDVRDVANNLAQIIGSKELDAESAIGMMPFKLKG